MYKKLQIVLVSAATDDDFEDLREKLKNTKIV